MGALPKQRISHHRRGNRRRNIFLAPIQLVACKHCREMKRPHHVCPSCGMYNGRQVLTIEDRKSRDEE